MNDTPEPQTAPPPSKRRGGRTKGTPNKSTAELKALAAKHGPSAIRAIRRIAKKAERDGDKDVAIKAYALLLDRGYGKPAQSNQLSGPDGGPIKVESNAREILAGRISGIAARSGAAGAAGESQ